MPWDVGVFDSRADYKSEKQCQRSSFAFYQSVRDLLPVWALEDMRAMEVFHWEDEDARACAFSPSEALLYALVHDHQQYAHYLLARFSVRALEMPSRSFCCCQASSAPHLSVAVRYNRVAILKMIMARVQDFSSEGERRGYLDGRACAHVDGGKAALHLACELVRPECLVLLLARGANPSVADSQGDTPLDLLLRQIRQEGEEETGATPDLRRKQLCLGYLLLFTRRLSYRMKREVVEEEAVWRRLVGEQAVRWLSGVSPPSLFVQAMQKLTQSIPPEQLDSLPDFLKPLDFRLPQAQA